LKLSDKQTKTFLFTTLSVGAFFVAVFLAAYLGGLPSTVVFTMEPAFRIALSLSGALFVVFILSALFLATVNESD
jgi:hypothetical protein